MTEKNTTWQLASLDGSKVAIRGIIAPTVDKAADSLVNTPDHGFVRVGTGTFTSNRHAYKRHIWFLQQESEPFKS